jgi:hypothetical protein
MCHAVSVTDPYDRILGFLDRKTGTEPGPLTTKAVKTKNTYDKYQRADCKKKGKVIPVTGRVGL